MVSSSNNNVSSQTRGTPHPSPILQATNSNRLNSIQNSKSTHEPRALCFQPQRDMSAPTDNSWWGWGSVYELAGAVKEKACDFAEAAKEKVCEVVEVVGEKACEVGEKTGKFVTELKEEAIKDFIGSTSETKAKEASTSEPTRSSSEVPAGSSPANNKFFQKQQDAESSKKPTEDLKVTSGENSITPPVDKNISQGEMEQPKRNEEGAEHLQLNASQISTTPGIRKQQENSIVVVFEPTETADSISKPNTILDETTSASTKEITEQPEPKELDSEKKIQPPQHQPLPPNSLLFNAPFQKLGGSKKLDLTLPVGSTVILRVDKETAQGLVAQTAGSVPIFSKSKTPLELGNSTFQHNGSECYFLKLTVGQKGIAFKDITGEGDLESLNSMLGSSNLMVNVPQGADPSVLKILFGSQPLKPVQGNEETEDDSKTKMLGGAFNGAVDDTKNALVTQKAQQAHDAKQEQSNTGKAIKAPDQQSATENTVEGPSQDSAQNSGKTVTVEFTLPQSKDNHPQQTSGAPPQPKQY